MKRTWDALIAWAAGGALALMLVENTPWGQKRTALFGFLYSVAVALFIVDVGVKFIASSSRKDFLRQYWFKFIAFLPAGQYALGVENLPAAALARQATFVVMLLSRARRTQRPVSQLSARPAQTVVKGFLLVIGIGTILLMMPAASVAGARTSLIDALFTATSAMCLTGLTVLDTAAYYSQFGQLVILALIQLGGLGIMTAAVTMVLMLRKSMEVRQQAALQDTLDQDTLAGARKFTFFIVGMTASIELAGIGLLALAWRDRFGDWASLAYHSAFQAVSAFCNAGFSTFSDNLMSYRDHVFVNMVIGLLIVAGGAGFTVIKDLADSFRSRFVRDATRRPRLRVQTRIVLTVTLILILGGALLIYAIERNASFRGYSERSRVLASVFQSISARTAGFNTCDTGRLSPASLFALMALMFIGASPGSTAGGIKTTTLAVLWAVIISRLRGRDQAQMFRRTIPVETMLKAVSVLCVSLVVVLVFAGALMYTENALPLGILFETVSAFGTVGLSTGVTRTLSPAGRLLITLLMLIGRLGPLTMGYALVLRRSSAKYVYAEERVMIG